MSQGQPLVTPPTGSSTTAGPRTAVVLGVIFAVLFDRVRYEAVAKSIVFIPMAISATAAGVIWKLMYADDPHTGTINAIVQRILPHFQGLSFLGDSSFVNFALMGAQ